MIKLLILINVIIVQSVLCHHESRVNFFDLIFGSRDGRHDCSCSKYRPVFIVLKKYIN